MDESELYTLIQKGENESVDFKQEIDLDSGKGKAEFTKDVISIANSSIGKGYLIIGVDKSNTIIGVDRLEEEQIQQIAYTYITPAVSISCSYVEIKDSLSLKRVGVIEIRALKRPHKVARMTANDNIKQDDVFIRRGSVVMKASPEEIIRMYEDSAGILEKLNDIHQRAMAHAKIGQLSSAISLYSEAIDILPTAELLISRAKLYEDQKDYFSALNDYLNSLKLNPSIKEEKAARLGCIRQSQRIRDDKYSWGDGEKDYQWLKEHTEGKERGEVIYTYIIYGWDYLAIDGLKDGEEMVSLVDEAINLGFDNPKIYYLRSIGNKAASNNGAALHDIDKAISKMNNSERKLEFLCHRAEVLFRMREYQEANKTLEEARKIDRDGVSNYLNLESYKIEEELLCLFGLEKKFSGDENLRSEPIFSMLKLLLLWNGRFVTKYTTDKEGKVTQVKTKLDDFVSDHPQVISSLLRLLNNEEKIAIKNRDSEYVFEVRMPKLSELLSEKKRIFISIPRNEDDE